ncbi:MAG TPA: extracellular solute-binding protein [Phototrophicaceae bacterium]|nr:extracellular solute-binding protein [Phototrophicaceae bacterium]
MKRIVVFVMLMILLGTAVQAQTTATPAATFENEANTFIVWGPSGIEFDKYITDTFQERHPELKIVITDQGWDEALRQNLQNAILMGYPPDVVIGENYFRAFAAAGALVPLDDIMSKYQDDIIPATYAGAVYEGRVYAIPVFTGVFAFERNCLVIEAAGLDCDTPPQYWDDLLAEAAAIREAGAGDYYGYSLQGPGGTAVGSAFRIAVYQAQMDALPCADAACTIPDFNNPNVIPVYEMLREITTYTPPGLIDNTNEGQVYEALMRGISAYQIAGSWHVGWAKDAGCTTCRYSSIPVPRDGHPANLLVGNVLFGAPSQGRHPELAKEWLELLISTESQERVFSQLGRLPVRRSVLSGIQETVDPATATFINELLYNEDLGILPQWEHNPKETWAIYNELLTAVLKTNRPIPEIMQAAQAAIEAMP